MKIFSNFVFSERYQKSLVIGVLVGLLVSNILIFMNTAGTAEQNTQNGQDIKAIAQSIKASQKEDQRVRDARAKDTIQRDAEMKQFVLCLFKVVIDSNRTGGQIQMQDAQNCQYTVNAPAARISGTTTLPVPTQNKPQTSVTQTPANNGAGDDGNNPESQDGAVRTLTNGLTETLRRLLRGDLF